MRTRKRFSALRLAVTLAAVQPSGVLAQSSGAISDPSPAEPLEVLLVTVAPGDAIVSRFGHSALWIRPADSWSGTLYGFGHSELAGDGLVRALLVGAPTARVVAADPDSIFDGYRRQGRAIWIDRLRIPPERAVALRDRLEDLVRGDARGSTYDFYLDNCTTGTRDAIDFALEGAIRARTTEVPSATTFRAITRRFTVDDPPLHAAIMVLLAHPVDRGISVWEEMAVPLVLRERLQEMSIVDRVTWTSGGPGDAEAPPREPSAPVGPAWRSMLLVGLALGAAFAVLGGASPRSSVGWWGFGGAASAWLVSTGAVAAAMIGFWTFSDLSVAHANANLLQMSPLAWATAVLLWRQSEPSVRWAGRAAAAVAGLAAFGALLGALPAVPAPFDQANLEIVALAVPAHVGLAWGLRAFPARPPRRSRPSSGSVLVRIPEDVALLGSPRSPD